jgi:hypothetical protein
MILSDLAVLIQETVVEIKDAERILAEDSKDFFALSALQALEKRLAVLQTQFDNEAESVQLEVLRYRILANASQATVRTINDLLATFQQAFTITYDALMTATAKKRARASEASISASTLGFAYSFAGSVGFALTLPREMSLLNHEHYNALALIQKLSMTRAESDAKAFANSYGLGTVRTIYKWFDAICKTGVDSELQWRGLNDPRMSFTIQVSDAIMIRNLLSGVHDIEHVERSYRGSLVAYDSVRRTFRFVIRNSMVIHGTVAERISEQLTVPAPYVVKLRVAIISKYSSEEKEEKFEMIDVQRPDDIS